MNKWFTKIMYSLKNVRKKNKVWAASVSKLKQIYIQTFYTDSSILERSLERKFFWSLIFYLVFNPVLERVAYMCPRPFVFWSTAFQKDSVTRNVFEWALTLSCHLAAKYDLSNFNILDLKNYVRFLHSILAYLENLTLFLSNR